MIVFLVGMPGVGKSYWLKKLKHHFLCSGTDLDLYIEIKSQARISELFEQGEAHFRYLEANALREVVAANSDVSLHIISTGGGTPCFEDNMAYMKSVGPVVYLKASASFIKSRLEQAKVIRPLIENVPKEERLDFLEALLAKRTVHYEQSDFILDAMSARLNNFVPIFNPKN
jgi:shikimate kinase